MDPLQVMLTSIALVIFQNSMRVPIPALARTTKLVLLSRRYRKITACNGDDFSTKKFSGTSWRGLGDLNKEQEKGNWI